MNYSRADVEGSQFEANHGKISRMPYLKSKLKAKGLLKW
jgi:hypothetical protein